MESLRIGPLGIESEIVFLDDDAARLRAEIARLWERVPSVGGAVRQRFALGGKAAAGPGAPPRTDGDGVRARHVRLAGEASLLAYLTSMVTIDSILAQPTPRLLLHASAVADLDGRVVGFVGPSGAGKTTIARALGAHYGYVTDETLAVTADDLAVHPYPKPLSLVSAGEPKRQCSPAELGLQPLPEAALRLHRLVVIERDSSLGDAPAHVEPLAISDAILAMVPQSSRFDALALPLATLAGVIEATGGALRVRYGEAARLVELVPGLLDGSDAVPERAVSAGVVTRPGASVPRGSWRVRAGVEWRTDSAGRTLVYSHGELHELGGVAPVLWDALLAAGGAASVEHLVDAAVAVFGAPPAGDARDRVVSAMETLADSGVVAAV